MTDHELINACSIWSNEHRAAHIAEIERRQQQLTSALQGCDTEEEARSILAKDADFHESLELLRDSSP